MPQVAIVDGVKIMFYANEHPPPHFHAIYGEHRAVIDIDDMVVAAGSPPIAKRRAIIARAAQRKEQLRRTFEAAASHEKIGPIE